MRGKGQLLISTLLLFFLNVAAQNEDANVDSDSEDAEVRVTSSSNTLPTIAISSSSSSSSSSGGGGAAALNAQAAMREGLGAMQTPLSLSPDPGRVQSFFLPSNYGHKTPHPALHSPASSTVLNSSSLLSKLGREESPTSDSDKLGKNGHVYNHRYYRQRRRGGYTVPYFVGKRVWQARTHLQQKDLERRNTRQNDLEASSANRDDPALFTDKRYTPMFVGKRSSEAGHPEHRAKRQAYTAPYFVGKRTLEESEDLQQEELQKRDFPGDSPVRDLSDLQLPPDLLALGDSPVRDLSDLQLSPDLLGLGDDEDAAAAFLDKRQAPLFVGKRRAPFFVGRRTAPYFVGRRTYPAVSHRAAPLFVGRRRQAPLFIGRRHAPLFVGKRPLEAQYVGKRRAPMFVGKRPNKDWNELLSALHTLQAARHYRRMIQADKRHNAPFFIGRRSAPPTDGAVRDTPETKSAYFR